MNISITKIFTTVKLSLLIIFMASLSAMAQQDTETITGTVVNAATGEPLVGANISLEGTNIGTSTNIDGEYELTVPDLTGTLAIFYVGYHPQTVVIDGREEINIALEEAVYEMDEVVAIGYGTERRADLTGSVSTISSKDVRAVPVDNAVEAMQGRSAGVVIRTSSFKPGGGQYIRIRGLNSIQGSNSPLIVVDGVPGASLNSLQPEDIESISILKDAAAASIYGSRAANGVILVTTHSGEGELSVEYRSNIGISEPTKMIEMMNAREYMEYVNDARQRQGLDLSFSDIDGVVNEIGEGHDWMNEMLGGKGMMQQNSISVRGGTENATYAASLGYRESVGIMETVDFSRLNARFNVSAQATERLNLRGIFTYSSTKQNDLWETSQPKHIPPMDGIRFPPTIFPRDERGNLTPLIYDTYGDRARPYPNVIHNLVNTMDNSEGRNMEFNFTGDFEFTNNFMYSAQMGSGTSYSESRYFRPSYVTYVSDDNLVSQDVASKNFAKVSSWVIENVLTFEEVFNDIHRITAIAGNTFEKSFRETTGASGSDFPFDTYQFHSLETSNPDRLSVSSSFSQSQLVSFFGRVNYSLYNKYLFQFNGRYDGSSKFAPRNRWAFFPSASFAWRLSNEEFIDNLNLFFDTAKLRVSYGELGSHAIGNYATMQRFNAGGWGSYAFGGREVGLYYPSGIANRNLKWETTSQWDIGLDLGFMDDRLSLIVDYYKKVTTDLLLGKNISMVNYPQGGRHHNPSISSNLGSLENKGFEVEMTYTTPFGGDFNWLVSLNGAVQQTMLTDLAFEEGQEYAVYGGNIRRNFHIMEEGKPYGNYYGYETDGLYQTEAEIAASAQKDAKPGDMKYVDQNGDGVIDSNDKVVLGNAIPDFTGGFQSTFIYRDFELSFFLFSMLGHDLFNYDAYYFKYGMEQTEYNKRKEVATDRWTGEGTSNDIPRAGYKPANITDGPEGAIDVLIEDASFVKLRNLSLTYNLPVHLTAGLGISHASVYIQGKNLYTLTGYSGTDPEQNVGGGSTTFLSVNSGFYPAVRTYLVGIEIGL